jgi:hypothetical protein
MGGQKRRKSKTMRGGSGYTPLNPENFKYNAANYSVGAEGGQVSGIGYSGISSNVEATSGHAVANTMKGGKNMMKGGNSSYGLNGNFPISGAGPYSGYGGIAINPTNNVVRSLNGFQSMFKGGKGKSRKRRSIVQRGCSRKGRARRRRKTMRGGNADYSQAYGTKFTFNPTGVNAAEGTIGMANPMPFSAYPGCGAKGL